MASKPPAQAWYEAPHCAAHQSSVHRDTKLTQNSSLRVTLRHAKLSRPLSRTLLIMPRSPAKRPAAPPCSKADDDDDEFGTLPTPPKTVKAAFEDGFPVEVRALMYSDQATRSGPTGNYALWMNPTRKFNRKPGGGDPGFNNNHAVETALATAGLQFPVKCASRQNCASALPSCRPAPA